MKAKFIQLVNIAEKIDNSIPGEIVFTFPAGTQFDLFVDMTDIIIQPEEGLAFDPSDDIASSSFTVSFHRHKLRDLGIVSADNIASYVTGNLVNQTQESIDPVTGLQKDITSNLFIIGKTPYIGDSIRENHELWDAINSFMLYRWICRKADIPNNGIVYYLTHEPLGLKGGKFNPRYVCSLKTSYPDFKKYFEGGSDEKRAMLKSQLFKLLCHIDSPESRTEWLFSGTNFDMLFEKTQLAYDRYCLRYGEDRLAAQLEKESLDIIERVKGIGESLKSELIVLATNALGLSAVEFDSSLTSKTILIGLSIILINVVFQFVLCNGYVAFGDLKKLIKKRRELLLSHNPEQQHSEINEEFDKMNSKISSNQWQFRIASVILWIPMLIGVLVFFFWPNEASKAIVDLSLKVFS